MTNTQLKTKPIKLRKKPGTKYYLGCKDYNDNLKPQEIKMTNKVLQEKSNCVCWSSKSRFLKIHTTKNRIGQQGSKISTLLKQVKNKK